jgi:hypothetical protein
MASSEDRQFFEDLNRDLANALGDAISTGFDNGMGRLENAINGMSQGVADAVQGAKKRGDDKEKGEKEETTKLQALQKAIGNFTKAAASIRAIGKPLEGAGKGIIGFGNTMARTVAQTGNMALVNARMVKDAAGNFKDLKFGEMSESITKSFGKFGIDFGKTGVILDTALKNNANVNDKGSQEFLARAVGLGNDLGLATQAIATNTNFLGMSTDASNDFNESMIDTAKMNGRVADVIMRAVEAFKENTRAQQNVFGTQFSQTMRDVVANIQGAMPDTGLIQAVGKITGTGFQQQMAMRTLGARVGVSAEELQADPQKALARIFKGIEADLARFTDPLQRASQMEMLAAQSGLTTQDLDAILTQSQGKTAAELERIFRGDKLTDEEREKEKRGEQAIATGMSEDAATAMKDFRLAIAGADDAFGIMSEAADFAREALYGFGDAAAQVAGDLAGMTTGVGSAARSTGLADIGSSILGVISFAADIASLRRGRVPKGGGRVGNLVKGAGSKVGTFVKGTAGKAGRVLGLGGAMQTASTGRMVGGLGAPGRLSQALGARAAGGQFVGKGLSKAANVGRVALKGGSKRIPILGSLVAGGLEYAESGDKSRAIAKGAGSAGGALAGAAAGAAIGSVVPVVGTAIGGIIGGILGGLGGEKLAEVGHDALDPEFVAKQEAEKKQQMQAEKFEGTPEELRNEAKAMALQQHQLDEQVKLNTNIERLISITSTGPVGPDMGPGNYVGQAIFHTNQAAQNFDARYDDKWEQIQYLNTYRQEYAALEASRRGGNN